MYKTCCLIIVTAMSPCAFTGCQVQVATGFPKLPDAAEEHESSDSTSTARTRRPHDGGPSVRPVRAPRPIRDSWAASGPPSSSPVRNRKTGRSREAGEVFLGSLDDAGSRKPANYLTGKTIELTSGETSSVDETTEQAGDEQNRDPFCPNGEYGGEPANGGRRGPAYDERSRMNGPALEGPQFEEPDFIEDGGVFEPAPNNYPIDLPTVLRLAGADNWNVRLAVEQICTARARYDAASVLWLPSLRTGLGFTKHEGEIQATEGEVIEVSRQALFLGGGAGVGDFPLTGGGGGPARLAVDLSLSDAIFKPLAARQRVAAAQAGAAAATNDSVAEATVAYFELIGAQGLSEVALQNTADARRMLDLTEAFVEAGKGAEADVSRVKVEVTRRRQAEIDARMQVGVASAELARILQLDPSKLDPSALLFSLDRPMPVNMVPLDAPLESLIAQAQTARPEVVENLHRVGARGEEYRAEKWRPLIPNLYAGSSMGVFGGGPGAELDSLDGRADFDVVAVWQVRNLGLGERAARNEAYSLYTQETLRKHRLHDVITAEVTKSRLRSQAQHERLQLAEQNIADAQAAWDRSLKRIQGLAGLPLEAIQAHQALVMARIDYVAAVTAYNQAQTRLVQAIGGYAN